MRSDQNQFSRFFLALSAATVITLCPIVIPISAFAQNDIEVMGRRPIERTRSARPIVVDDAINIIGFEDVKPGSKGRLEIGDDGIRLSNDKAEGLIPVDAIQFFAVEHGSKGLLRGTAGTLASLAPNGAGQIYSAIRPGAETLTLFYRDENDALHGAVILIPKSSKDETLSAFARLGIVSGDSSTLASIQRGPSDRRVWVPVMGHGDDPVTARRSTVEIGLPLANDMLPAAFTAATYEALIAQTRKSGLFAEVWRQGDSDASPDALRLSIDVTEYKKGNPGVRGAIPVVGMIAGKTLIRANLRLEEPSGRVLLEEEVKGSKRMIGESIAASTSLAQRSTKALSKAPGLSKGAPLPDESGQQVAFSERRQR